MTNYKIKIVAKPTAPKKEKDRLKQFGNIWVVDISVMNNVRPKLDDRVYARSLCGKSSRWWEYKDVEITNEQEV